LETQCAQLRIEEQEGIDKQNIALYGRKSTPAENCQHLQSTNDNTQQLQSLNEESIASYNSSPQRDHIGKPSVSIYDEQLKFNISKNAGLDCHQAWSKN
jgi:hypothetical protein